MEMKAGWLVSIAHRSKSAVGVLSRDIENEMKNVQGKTEQVMRSIRLNTDQNATAIVKERETPTVEEAIETTKSIDIAIEITLTTVIEIAMVTVTETGPGKRNAGANETTRKKAKMTNEARGLRSKSRFSESLRLSQTKTSSKSATMPCRVSCPGTFRISTSSITGSRT